MLLHGLISIVDAYGVFFFSLWAPKSVNIIGKSQVYANFYLKIVFISSDFFYDINVTKSSSLWIIFQGLFEIGLALGQLALGLNKTTGKLIIFTIIPALLEYLLSYLRYGEKI